MYRLSYPLWVVFDLGRNSEKSTAWFQRILSVLHSQQVFCCVEFICLYLTFLPDGKLYEGGYPIYSLQYSQDGVLLRQAPLWCLINRLRVEPSPQYGPKHPIFQHFHSWHWSSHPDEDPSGILLILRLRVSHSFFLKFSPTLAQCSPSLHDKLLIIVQDLEQIPSSTSKMPSQAVLFPLHFFPPVCIIPAHPSIHHSALLHVSINRFISSTREWAPARQDGH